MKDVRACALCCASDAIQYCEWDAPLDDPVTINGRFGAWLCPDCQVVHWAWTAENPGQEVENHMVELRLHLWEAKREFDKLQKLLEGSPMGGPGLENQQGSGPRGSIPRPSSKFSLVCPKAPDPTRKVHFFQNNNSCRYCGITLPAIQLYQGSVAERNKRTSAKGDRQGSTPSRASNPGQTHFVGDDCPGGHENREPVPARDVDGELV